MKDLKHLDNDSLDSKITNQEFQDLIQQHHHIVGDRVTGYLTKNYNLIQKHFTKKELYQLTKQSQINEAQTELEFRHKLLQLSTDFKLQALTEKYDNWLKVIKIEYRHQFTVFVTDRQSQLQKTINERRTEFASDISQQYEQAQQYSNVPLLHKKYTESVEKNIEKYFDWLDSLLNNFMNIVEEKISQYK